MSKRLAVALCGLFLVAGCRTETPAESYYSPLYPPHFIEEHPTKSNVLALPVAQKVKPKGMLVLPLYEGNGRLVVRNPFITEDAEDLENKLRARGELEDLVRVILWIPGYLPVAIPKIFRMELPIEGRKSTLIELHKENFADGSAARMAVALQDLLGRKTFTVGQYVNTVDEYVPMALVTACEYGSQYPAHATLYGVKTQYVLWAFNPGTMIEIAMDARSTEEVAKVLRQHAAPAAKAASSQPAPARAATTGPATTQPENPPGSERRPGT